MSDKRRLQIEAHDAAGYETDFFEFSNYDDGYGNNVAHGDLSMQRMVEGGVREATWPTEAPEGSPNGYDTDPFQSDAQRRFMFAKHPEIAKRWAKETPKGKDLPEHVHGYDKDPMIKPEPGFGKPVEVAPPMGANLPVLGDFMRGKK